jgi:hypothetical protein
MMPMPFFYSFPAPCVIFMPAGEIIAAWFQTK